MSSPSAQTANIVVSTTNKGVPTKSFTVVISQKGFAYSFGVDNQAISVKETETSAVIQDYWKCGLDHHQ
jgi:hypothetical protein